MILSIFLFPAITFSIVNSHYMSYQAHLRNSPNRTRKNGIMDELEAKKDKFIAMLESLKDTAEVTFPDGKYVGQLTANQLREGKGIFYYPVGDVYFGEWKEDYFHGEGVYLFKSG